MDVLWRAMRGMARVPWLECMSAPLNFRNDVPGAADCDEMRSRARRANAGGVTV